MENRSFYNEILTEHNIHPEFKHDIPDADIELAGVNPSCGDNIVLKLKTDGDVITDGGFVGDGCAISQASADIMLGMIVGQKKEKALEMGRTFLRMIHGEATEEEIESLEEASALKDIAHMPARVKCAMLGWRTLSEALTGKVENKPFPPPADADAVSAGGFLRAGNPRFDSARLWDYDKTSS